MNSTRFKLVTVAGLVLSVAAAACASSGGDGTRGASSDLNQDPNSSKTGGAVAGKTPTGASAAATGNAEAPPSQTSASLSLDGKPCTIGHSGLDTGLDGHGWTLSVEATCKGSLHLNVSGVSDAPYPQTATTPFLAEEAAIAFIDRGDGQNADTFIASGQGGTSKITAGPTSAARARVTGSAEIVGNAENGSGVASHTVQYDFAF